MNPQITPTPRGIKNKKQLILLYNDYEYTLFFPKENINSITVNDDLSISTDTLYKELLNNEQAEIENEVIHIQNNKIIDKEEIKIRLEILQRIIDSFSIDSFSIESKIQSLVESIPFFLSLNLISLVRIILKQLKKYIKEKKLFSACDEVKVKIYLNINYSAAIIQEELSFKKCYNNKAFQYLNSLIIIFNEYISILISILTDISNEELELFINTIKKEYLVVEDINNEDNNNTSFILLNRDFSLFINIVKIVIITIINNKNLSNSAKLEILREIVIDNNRIIKINTHNNTNEYSLLELSHEMLTFFDKKIYSSILTRAYITNIANNKNDFENLIKVIKLLLDLNKNNKVEVSLDSNQLYKKISLFPKLFYFNKDSSNPIKLQIQRLELEYHKQAILISQLEKKDIDKKTIIEDLNSKLELLSEEKNALILKNVSLIDNEEQYKKKIEELLKHIEDVNAKCEGLIEDKEDLINKNNKLIEEKSKISNEMNMAVIALNNILDNVPNRSINELIEQLNGLNPITLRQLNSLIVNRGYDYTGIINLVKLINSYNNEDNNFINNNDFIDSKIFGLLGKLSIIIYCYANR